MDETEMQDDKLAYDLDRALYAYEAVNGRQALLDFIEEYTRGNRQ
jgi:hypothetical protein